MSSLGLILSGGGARAAYQAGAIAAIVDISSELKIPHPFDFYTGVSSGALNAAMLAASANCDLSQGSKKIVELWSLANSDQVYNSNPLFLSAKGLKLIAELSLGGAKKSTPQMALLDTSPLKELISRQCDFSNIQKNINNKKFKALAVSALDYFSSSTVTFVQGLPTLPNWQRVRRHSEKVQITASHVMASAAIPVLFPPVTVGESHFGDGSIHNLAPCGPAIYMGADKLIAIGVRRKREICWTGQPTQDHKPPTIGRVFNVLLHTLMMDGFETDIERMERINMNISKLSETERRNLSVRPVQHIWISPSRNITEMAADKLHTLPAMIRYLLRGLGPLQDTSEIASFLLFESSYCTQLIDLGFEDAMKQKEKIRRLLSS
ncbi:MAG: patatin-like phospholipase family protein [Bdellovibrio sp.]